MKAFYHSIFLLLFCLTAGGCVNRDIDMAEEYYKVDISDIETVSLSEIATDIQIIELGASSDIILGPIDFIKSYDNYLVLQDFTSTQTISVFSSDGEFVSQLNRRGRGPGEYLAVDCFAVDEKAEILYVYDRSFNVYRYSFPEMEFLNKYRVPGHYYSNIEVVEGRLLVVMEPNRQRLPVGGIAFLADDNTTPDYLGLPDGNMSLEMSMPHAFTKTEEGFLYASTGVHSGIYNIDSKGVKHLITIDFDKNNPSQEVMDMEEVDDFYDKLFASPFASFINSVVMTKNKLAFNFMYDSGIISQYLAVIDRNSSSVNVYSGIELYPGYNRLSYVKGIYDNYYLTVLYPEQIDSLLPDDGRELQSWQKQLLEKRGSTGIILLAYKLV